MVKMPRTLFYSFTVVFAFLCILPRLCAAQDTENAPKATVVAPVPSISPGANAAFLNSMEVLDDKRKISPGDRISYRVIEEHKQPLSLLVTDSGEIEVPLIGRVDAQNKTCKQLAYEIKVPLEKDYFYKATVIIGLDFGGRSRGRVYITGNVRSAGPMELPPDENLTVSRAILRAGGFDQFANKHRVRLVRKKPETSTGTETTIVDVGDIIDHGHAEKDITLLPDDMIVVPRALINY